MDQLSHSRQNTTPSPPIPGQARPHERVALLSPGCSAPQATTPVTETFPISPPSTPPKQGQPPILHHVMPPLPFIGRCAAQAATTSKIRVASSCLIFAPSRPMAQNSLVSRPSLGKRKSRFRAVINPKEKCRRNNKFLVITSFRRPPATRSPASDSPRASSTHSARR